MHKKIVFACTYGSYDECESDDSNVSGGIENKGKSHVAVATKPFL